MVNTGKRKYLISIHLAVLLFGVAGLFGKWLSIVPEMIVFGRVVFGAVALLVFIWVKNRKSKLYGLKINSVRDFSLLLLNGFLLAVHWFSFFQSIRLSTVAIVLLTYSTFPVFTAVLEPVFFKVKFRLSSLFLALLAFAGVYIILPEMDLANTVTRAVLWGVLSGFTFSLIALVNKGLVRTYTALSVSFYLDLFAALFLFPLLFLQQHFPTVNEVALLLLLGVVFTALAHTLFVYGLKKISASVSSLIACLEPVYGIILALLLLGEMPPLKQISGAILIILAMVLGSLRHGHNPT